MGNPEAPPDATTFVSQGVPYFLYMGPLEMRALQREWGLTRVSTDTAQEWQAKCITLADRLNGGNMFCFDEKLPVFRHALSRWADAAGVDRAELTDDRVADIVGNVDLGRKRRRQQPFFRANTLFLQFMSDCFREDEEEEEPEAPAEDGEDSAETPKGRSRRTRVSTQSST